MEWQSSQAAAAARLVASTIMGTMMIRLGAAQLELQSEVPLTGGCWPELLGHLQDSEAALQVSLVTDQARRLA